MRSSYLCSILVMIGVTLLDAVTVNPNLCPTNKIAPHKRIASWNSNGGNARTFGAFYDLLAPSQNAQGPDVQNQESDEQDENDCGEIDDYDENDLSALTNPQRRQGRIQNQKFFFGGFFDPPQTQPVQGPNRPGYPPSRPEYPPNRPGDTPNRPGNIPNRPGNIPNRPGNIPNRPGNIPNRPGYPPQSGSYPVVRPPYWSGGFFGGNPYRPPLQQFPSDNIKPVHEDTYENDIVTYRPSPIVGGPINHVVGVSQVRPTGVPALQLTTRVPLNTPRYPTRTSPPPLATTRRSRPRNLSNNDNSIIGSFIDLLFK